MWKFQLHAESKSWEKFEKGFTIVYKKVCIWHIMCSCFLYIENT